MLLALRSLMIDHPLLANGVTRYFVQGTGCPLVAIDWSQFNDAGLQMGGTAAVYAEALVDVRLMWFIHELQSMGYTVSLYAPPHAAATARHFLASIARGPLGDASKVQVIAVHVRGALLDAPPVKLFVHVAGQDGLPTVLGRGAANILLVQSINPTAGDKAASVIDRQPQHTIRSQDVPAVLASYDYMLYTSNEGYVAHMPHVTPVLEQLQLQSKMFPLVDILPLPAPPLLSAAAALAAADAVGITVSMSVYREAQRTVLVDALQAFARLASKSAIPPRLVICTWLMPGKWYCDCV
jgi:hypothetical protein